MRMPGEPDGVTHGERREHVDLERLGELENELRDRRRTRGFGPDDHRRRVAQRLHRGDLRLRDGILSRRALERVPALDRLRSEEHTSELQSRQYLVCRLLLEKNK